MLPFDEPHRALVHLIVHTADTATEIVVRDGSFQDVARGLGRLETDLPPGLYKIRVRAGGQEAERNVLLAPPDGSAGPSRAGPNDRVTPGSVEVYFEPLVFASPAPLPETGASEEQRRLISDASRTVDLKKGHGSEVFVCSRDESWPGRPAPFPRLNPATGLTLRDAKGGVVADLERASVVRVGQGDPWAACNVELDPGLYRLSIETPVGRLNHTVVASPGWQTQIYLLQATYGRGRSGRRADLNGAAVILSRPGLGFDPSAPDQRLTELARLGLRDRRAVIGPADIARMVEGKFENPMLGLFAAYLLLQRQREFQPNDPPRQLLRVVLRNLRRMLGHHPDVEALALRIEEIPDPPPVFSTPPALSASWRAIRHVAFERPEIIPAGSLLARVGARFWGPRPLLVWRDPEEEPGEEGTGAVSDLMVAATAPLTAEQLIERIRGMHVDENRRDLDGYDRDIVRTIAASPAAPAKETMKRLVEVLNLPEPAVFQKLMSLYRKLTRTG